MNSSFDILMIDDEQVIINAVVRICSVEHLKVDTAMDAGEALDKAKKNSYHLIICDIMLPGLDGFQILEQLKPLGNSTAFIMTTGYTTVENAVKSLSLGAIDFLHKPFTSDEFCCSIKRGFKYVNICENDAQKITQNEKNFRSYAQCPINCFRLGYGAWLTVEHTGSVVIGATDFFLKTIETVNSVFLWDNEQEILQGNQCAMISCDDGSQHGILSPITGRIIEKNKRVESKASLIEKDPFSSGWLYRVLPTDLTYEMKYLVPGSSEKE